MKTYLSLMILAVMCCAVASAQSLDGDPEHVVRAILESKSPGVADSGIVDKQLSRMGDAASVALTKVIAGRKLSALDIDRVLLIVHLSFGAPQIVEPAQQEPRAALFVLNFLELMTTDARQIRGIRETRSYIQEQYRRATAQPRT